MPTLLTTHAAEGGTYAITGAFTDDAGSAVSPDTLKWTLTNDSGTVINSRQDVSISTPTSSETVVLSGDDLSIGSNGVVRVFTFEGTYTSDLGSGLPLKGQATFVIDNLIAVT
jgi:hypothetical protein